MLLEFIFKQHFRFQFHIAMTLRGVALMHHKALLDQVEIELQGFATQFEASLFTPVSPAIQAGLYHLSTHGQRTRAKIAISAAYALGLQDKDTCCIATSVELLHNASLIHDDIQDNDALRRGKNAVWTAFDSNTALCAGDLLLSAAYCSLARLSCTPLLPRLIGHMHKRVSEAVDGQCDDLHHAKNKNIDLPKYIDIVTRKSGSLLALPLDLCLIATNNESYLEDASKLSNAFSLAYQIVDDLNDFVADTACLHKEKALNVLSVLKGASSQLDPLAEAKRLAHQSLDAVVVHAKSLPSLAGNIYMDFATNLRRSLL